jgi:glycosyltransferase involved in cell wall biosynthesis
MRIAIDAGNFARDRRGMGRIARTIANGLLAAGDVAATFLVERPRDEAGIREAFAGQAIDVRPAATALAADAYDVVWFPWNGMRYDAAAPVLLTLNDVFAFTDAHPERIAREREQAPIRRGSARADRIVTISQWSKGEIARVLEVDPQRIAVIAPAPDPFFAPGDDNAFMAAWRYVLLVGTREPRKNARVVFEACARALLGPRDALVIAGGLSRENERLLRELGVQYRHVPDPDDETLRALYRNARVVAVPSTAEGFGLVAVEAMASGAPVVAARSSALPEATGGAAMLLDPRAADAWSDAFTRLFADDALAHDLAARGLAHFAFASRERPLRAYLEVLRRLSR